MVAPSTAFNECMRSVLERTKWCGGKLVHFEGEQERAHVDFVFGGRGWTSRRSRMRTYGNVGTQSR